MSVKGGLRLRREVAPVAALPPTRELPVADIWVDASVYHLDTPFSYLVPEKFTDLISVGSLVSIPFHGREVVGVVVARRASLGESGLKSISKPIGEIPLLSPEILRLITAASERYAAHPFDLIRSAIPDRVAAVEKNYNEVLPYSAQRQRQSSKKVRQYLQLPPAAPRSGLIAQRIASASKEGGVIAVMPDTREVARLADELTKLSLDFRVLDSSLPKSELYRNFLDVRLSSSTVVIGTRSAIFAPVESLTSIFIYNEGSESFYERRSPGWNVRDLALLRGRLEDNNLFFIGYSPSAEVGRLIEEDWIDFRATRGRVKVNTVAQTHGELLPSRGVPIIKRALKSGPVLFVVPQKGYAQAIRCAKCKTISHCECGGAHEQRSAKGAITCNHCNKNVIEWSCIWCHEKRPALAVRGAERHLHELGLLFPGVESHISSADHPTQSLDRGFVVATPQMAPQTPNGYSAVVILEGNRFLDQPDMRAQERVREMFFAHAALAQSGAPVLLIQDEGHPVATALTTWNPIIAARRDLQERSELKLPPYVRAMKLSMKTEEISRLAKALEGAREEGRIPASTRILGPIGDGDMRSLILTVEVALGEELISTIHEFMRRRSLAKKSLPSLRIDPYSLSR